MKKLIAAISRWKSTPCIVGRKKKIMGELQSGIQEYLEEHADAAFEDVQNHFGEPGMIKGTSSIEELTNEAISIQAE